MNATDFFLYAIFDGEDKSSPFKNCLRNNYKHIRKWGKRTHTDCFRIYEREVNGFPLAVDYYAGRFCIHYFAKGADSEQPSPELVTETEKAICTLFDVSDALIFWRTRAKTKVTRQYEKNARSQSFFTVHEYGLKFNVNLQDYLDTGLFLDHRETRQLVASLTPGKRLLNLFAYTCSFSVHAAALGAVFTKSVDMSNTYLAWGQANFEINDLSLKTNQLVREDCMKFLIEEVKKGIKYDVIVIDPPTISRSKKMDDLFDIQVDYVFLIKQALMLLSDRGCIIFSTNYRKFEFETTLFPSCTMVEISHKTIPIDFMNTKIHRCWKITPLDKK